MVCKSCGEDSKSGCRGRKSFEFRREERKKGQISVEFLLIVSLAFLLLMLFMPFASRYFLLSMSELQREKIESLGRGVKEEVVTAAKSEKGYTREFSIPKTIEGEDYTIRNSRKYISLKFHEHEFSLQIPEVTGSLQKGENVIKKRGGELLLNQ